MTDARKIFGAFAVAIALFFVWPVVIGGWQLNSALSASVGEREKLLATRQETLANVQAAWQQYQSRFTNQQDGQKFAALVPVHKDTAEIISAIQDIADSSAITVGSIALNVGAPTPDQQFSSLTMNLDMNGSYAALRSFLVGLESYVRLLNVSSIGVTMDSKSGGALHFTVQATGYFLK